MSMILNEIRAAVNRSDLTRYRIAKDVGMSHTQMSRFMSGERGLSFDKAEELAAYLNLEIIIRPRRRRKGK
ncbi:MAG: helix-turn-helix domain-containing protein [Planctomycetota bacterium]|jgi:transcriptional regulator with XRE-family HTH domain